jgi:hypothetical protein
MSPDEIDATTRSTIQRSGLESGEYRSRIDNLLHAMHLSKEEKSLKAIKNLFEIL